MKMHDRGASQLHHSATFNPRTATPDQVDVWATSTLKRLEELHGGVARSHHEAREGDTLECGALGMLLTLAQSAYRVAASHVGGVQIAARQRARAAHEGQIAIAEIAVEAAEWSLASLQSQLEILQRIKRLAMHRGALWSYDGPHRRVHGSDRRRPER